MKNTTNSSTTRNLFNGVSVGFSGATSDGCSAAVEERLPKAVPSRAEVLQALPVSIKVCARFTQKAGVIERVIRQVTEQNPSMEFHVEPGMFETRVWRVA